MALGDRIANTASLGYLGAGLIFAGLLRAVGPLYFWTPSNRVALFRSAFILTRLSGRRLATFPTDRSTTADWRWAVRSR